VSEQSCVVHRTLFANQIYDSYHSYVSPMNMINLPNI